MSPAQNGPMAFHKQPYRPEEISLSTLKYEKIKRTKTAVCFGSYIFMRFSNLIELRDLDSPHPGS